MEEKEHPVNLVHMLPYPLEKLLQNKIKRFLFHPASGPPVGIDSGDDLHTGLLKEIADIQSVYHLITCFHHKIL